MLHMVGVNTSSDVIRQATLYAFAKTPESMSDEFAMAKPDGACGGRGPMRFAR